MFCASYFEKSVISGSGCDSSSVMHLKKCLKTHIVKMFKRTVHAGYFEKSAIARNEHDSCSVMHLEKSL